MMVGQFSAYACLSITLDPFRHGFWRTARAGRHAAEVVGKALKEEILPESLTRSGCGLIRASQLPEGSGRGIVHPARAVCRSTEKMTLGMPSK